MSVGVPGCLPGANPFMTYGVRMVEAVKHEIDRIGVPLVYACGGNLASVQFPGDSSRGSDTLLPNLGNDRVQRFGVLAGGGCIVGGQTRSPQLGPSGLRYGKRSLCPA